MSSVSNSDVPKDCREKARDKARSRRTQSKTLMEDLSEALPFSKEVVDSLDQSSRLRLALCYIRVKSLFATAGTTAGEQQHIQPARSSCGVLQDLFLESMDGFLIICQKEGQILYLSDSVHRHLGLFQSDIVGHSLTTLIHSDDLLNISQSIEGAHMRLLANQGHAGCTFFCRMKCSQKKGMTSSPLHQSYKLVYFSGQLKLQDDGNALVMGVVCPVTPPTIVELSVEDNMFVTHYSLELKCVYFDGRLKRLLGYDVKDLIGHVPFEFHHHDDIQVTLSCSQEMMVRGEGLSGYYRFMTKYGKYLWLQSRATIVYDKHTKCPQYVVCVNYVIVNDEVAGDKAIRRSLEPLPVDSCKTSPPLSPFSSLSLDDCSSPLS